MKQFKNSVLLFMAALIWGVAFVAQSEGMKYVGGFTFNCARSLIGGAVLIPVIFMMRKLRGEEAEVLSLEEKKKHFRDLLIGGVCCGFFLCVASNLQQQGLRFTTPGKAGFITALYIVLVPVLGLFWHKRVGKFVWLGLALAVAGLYFLCINGEFRIETGDFLVFLCAVVFSGHILVIDHFAPLADGVALSCIQFFVCGVLSAVPMFLFEDVSLKGLFGAAVPILYAGVMSCGVAYTFQILGQKNMNPTVASMILSMESVFSVLAGLVLLGQMPIKREFLGCALMFAAVILSQLPSDAPS